MSAGAERLGPSVRHADVGVGGVAGRGTTHVPETAADESSVRRGDVPASATGEAIDEFAEDARTGDVMALGGFVPQQLADYYVQMAADRDPGAALAARIDEIADKLVERILVTPSAGPGPEQMRIKFVDDVLEGSEIRVGREHGELRLDIVASGTRVGEFLAERADALTDALAERLKTPVHVRVDVRETPR